MWYRAQYRFFLWACNWVDLVATIIYILSFTTYSTDWSMKSRGVLMRWQIKQVKNKIK